MHYFNDGSDGFLYDPVYRMRVGLTPCEQRLIMHPALRRLHRIAHYGASARIVPVLHSRFMHTVGVLTLVFHFRAEDYPLRLAALLHDVGHLPFSHSAERALGLDHHLLTRQVLAEAGLNQILSDHGFEPDVILGLMEGRTPNPLVTGPAGMSLDHLDSWLRDTESLGIGQIPAHQILGRLRLNGPCVEAMDEEVAREIVRRSAADQRLFLRPRSLALDALVTAIFREAHPEVGPLLQMGDEEALDLAARQVPNLVDLLRYRPWDLEVRPDDGGEGWLAEVKRVYRSEVLLEGRPASDLLPEAAAVQAALEGLVRRYRVTVVA